MSTPQDEPEYLRGIQGEQSRRLITTPSKVVKAVAGPGAGKTTCLGRRIDRITTDPSAPCKRSEIFVGTFTRVIAKALSTLAASPINSTDPADVLPVFTLHSYALSLLKTNRHVIAGRELRFLLSHEESAMLYDIGGKIDDYRLAATRKTELSRLQAAWSKPRTLDDERFSGEVEHWLVRHRAMHVNEVVHRVTRALVNGDMESPRFKHVFIDEYQDLTECEQFFVTKIAAEDGSILVLGDNDQSIYRFRHNHPEGIEAFPIDAARRAELEPIPLPNNYRSAEPIVTLANAVMQLAGPTKAPMVVGKKEAGAITFVLWETLDDEIAGMAEALKARIAANPDFKALVLVTRTFIGYRLRDLLGDAAITTFREEVLDSNFVRERFALASLLADEDDPVSLRAWLSLQHSSDDFGPNRNAEAYATVVTSDLRGLKFIEAVASGELQVGGAGKGNIIARCQRYLAEREAFLNLNVDQAVKALFDSTLAENLPALAKKEDESDADLAARTNARKQQVTADLELLRVASMQIIESSEEATLQKVITEVRYRIATVSSLIDDENIPAVRIMTLHGAKGLEEESVFVLGLADEILPGTIDDDPAEQARNVAEQRRLLYVAITRAKTELVLSWPSHIASRDTQGTYIRQNQGFTLTNATAATPKGTFIRRMTKTTFLPESPTAPTRGATWLSAQLPPT